jgi:hypothetical protein
MVCRVGLLSGLDCFLMLTRLEDRLSFGLFFGCRMREEGEYQRYFLAQFAVLIEKGEKTGKS